MPTNYTYNAAITDLIDLDDLPEILSFLQDEIQQVLSNLYYNNYCGSTSIYGSSAFYSLDVICQQKIAVGIFGTGIQLVLNPDYSDDADSSFPITVFWEWEILKFINFFKVNGFSFSVNDLFNLGLLLFNLSEEQLLMIAANCFAVPDSYELSKFEQLVTDINQLYGTDIIINDQDIDNYQQLVGDLNNLGYQTSSTIFLLYVENANSATEVGNLNSFFSLFVPED